MCMHRGGGKEASEMDVRRQEVTEVGWQRACL